VIIFKGVPGEKIDEGECLKNNWDTLRKLLFAMYKKMYGWTQDCYG
jgi:hypothetical protein